MKTKVLFCAMLVMAVMSSCKKDYDIMGTMKDVANKTVRSTYVNWTVDSTNMKSIMSQYVYPATSNEGAFQVASAGNGLPIALSEEKVVWEDNGFAEGNLNTLLTATHESGLVKKFIFAHMSLTDESQTVYNSSLLNIYTTYKQIYDEFVPLQDVWSFRDTTRYIDTTNITHTYLRWTEEASKNITLDSVNKLRAFIEQQWVQDTIHWYNKEFGASVRDTVYFKATKNDPNLYNAISAVCTETSRIIQKYDTVGVATRDLMKLQFMCDAAGNQKMMAYQLSEEYSKEYYTNPTSEKAIATIEEVDIPEGIWCMVNVTNAKKFDILVKGDEKTTKKMYKNAGWATFTHQACGAYRDMNISGFDKKKQTMTCNEVKMALEVVE